MTIKTLLLTITLLIMTLTVPSASYAEVINWQPYEKGIAMAEEQGKKIFLYFHADWCTYCKKMKESTFQDISVVKYLSDNFISIAVDSDKEKKIASFYGVRGLPTLWLLKQNSTKLSSLPGYVDAKRLINILKYIRTESYAKMSFSDFINNM